MCSLLDLALFEGALRSSCGTAITSDNCIRLDIWLMTVSAHPPFTHPPMPPNRSFISVGARKKTTTCGFHFVTNCDNINDCGKSQKPPDKPPSQSPFPDPLQPSTATAGIARVGVRELHDCLTHRCCGNSSQPWWEPMTVRPCGLPESTPLLFPGGGIRRGAATW